jgi:hypothetical protein
VLLKVALKASARHTTCAKPVVEVHVVVVAVADKAVVTVLELAAVVPEFVPLTVKARLHV